MSLQSPPCPLCTAPYVSALLPEVRTKLKCVNILSAPLCPAAATVTNEAHCRFVSVFLRINVGKSYRQVNIVDQHNKVKVDVVGLLWKTVKIKVIIKKQRSSPEFVSHKDDSSF